MQHDMAVGDAAHTYTLLTIGDGLVAQIPSLIVSVAAGLVVSRVGDEGDVGGLVIGQLFSNPQVMVLTAAIIGVLGLIPGMPNLVFLLLAATLGGMAWMRRKRIAEEAAAAAAPEAAAQVPMPAADNLEASWNDVSQVDVLGLEVGYRLIPMVDKGQDGELLKRIRGLRKKFAQEVGFLSAPVHIRDNLELKPNGYRLALKGVETDDKVLATSAVVQDERQVAGDVRQRHVHHGRVEHLHEGGEHHRDGDQPGVDGPFSGHAGVSSK